MFTGLVEERGEVSGLIMEDGGVRLRLRAPIISNGIRVGESVAVNGCCLTVTSFAGEELIFDLLAETVQRTNLKNFKPGVAVNVERALAATGRLGGHFVQGHIDCTSEVLSFEASGADYRLELLLPPEFAHYVAFKGSIAINGISLTVAEVNAASFVVWIIPHTFAVTNLSSCRKGDLLNLEFDLLAKYVERLVSSR